MKCNTGDIELDWDTGAGEEWARIIHNQKGIVCMLNTKIGVAFICRNELNSETLEVLESLFLVDVFDYTSEIWCVDLALLEKQVPEIIWEAPSHVIDVTKMSLHDLYFATV